MNYDILHLPVTEGKSHLQKKSVFVQIKAI